MPQRPTSRREFLKGASAAEALQASTEWLPEAGEATAETVLLTLSRQAMACEFQIQLPVSTEENETAEAMAALDVIEAVEDRMTVYRSQSALMDLNRAAAVGPAVIEADLLELLVLGDRLFRETEGAFDLTSGPLSRAWGFSRRAGRMPSQTERDEALERVGWNQVELDLDARTIAFARPDLDVNFNSVAKGYALDKAAERLAEEEVADALLHGGRSTLVARGAAGPAGWRVGIRHPLRPQQRIAECRLRDAALSTSGSATQCFVHNGRRYGHLIDPRTGWPAEGLHSVSVVTSQAAEADALSTALYVMGFEAAEAYLSQRPEVQALFVLSGVRPDDVQLRGLNLDPDSWRFAEEV